MSETKKGGHPIVGVVLGILGLAAAIFLGFLMGTVGGIIAAVLGVLAIVLGIGARKGGRGIAPIILGVIAVFLALMMAAIGNGTVDAIRQQAEEKNLPLLQKYSEKSNMGFLGVIMNAAQDDVNVDALAEEFRLMTAEEGTVQTTASPETSENTEAAEQTESTENTEGTESAETTEGK